MSMKIKILIIALSLVTAPTGISIAQAQIGLDGATGESLSFSATPQIPGPNTLVNLSIESFSTDLNRADIKWEVNGVLQRRGVGETKFQLKTGEVGSTKDVRVTVQTREGKVLTEAQSFSPGLVDIIWQADSWVPPFYPGKGMAVAKAKIEAQAIAYMFAGKARIPARNLYYRWFYDFDPLLAQSGVGNDRITIDAPDLFGKKNLRVQVSSLDNKIVADTQISLSPSSPLAIVWRDDPLSGLDYENPVGPNHTFQDEEVTFQAGGVYFPISHALDPKLLYKWTLNGRPAVVDEDKPETLTIRRAEGGGEGQISLDIQDPFDRIISASKSFFIKASPKAFE
jgi:hypothetical protein